MTDKKVSSKIQDNFEILLYSLGTVISGICVLIIVAIALGLISFVYSTGEISQAAAKWLTVISLAPVAAFCAIVYKIFNPSSGGKKDGK